MSTFLTAAHHRVTVFFYWPIKNLESTMNNVPVNKTHHEYIRMCVCVYIYIYPLKCTYKYTVFNRRINGRKVHLTEA